MAVLEVENNVSSPPSLGIMGILSLEPVPDLIPDLNGHKQRDADEDAQSDGGFDPSSMRRPPTPPLAKTTKSILVIKGSSDSLYPLESAEDDEMEVHSEHGFKRVRFVEEPVVIVLKRATTTTAVTADGQGNDPRMHRLKILYENAIEVRGSLIRQRNDSELERRNFAAKRDQCLSTLDSIDALVSLVIDALSDSAQPHLCNNVMRLKTTLEMQSAALKSNCTLLNRLERGLAIEEHALITNDSKLRRIEARLLDSTEFGNENDLEQSINEMADGASDVSLSASSQMTEDLVHDYYDAVGDIQLSLESLHNLKVDYDKNLLARKRQRNAKIDPRLSDGEFFREYFLERARQIRRLSAARDRASQLKKLCDQDRFVVEKSEYLDPNWTHEYDMLLRPELWDMDASASSGIRPWLPDPAQLDTKIDSVTKVLLWREDLAKEMQGFETSPMLEASQHKEVYAKTQHQSTQKRRRIPLNRYKGILGSTNSGQFDDEISDSQTTPTGKVDPHKEQDDHVSATKVKSDGDSPRILTPPSSQGSFENAIVPGAKHLESKSHVLLAESIDDGVAPRNVPDDKEPRMITSDEDVSVEALKASIILDSSNSLDRGLEETLYEIPDDHSLAKSQDSLRISSRATPQLETEAFPPTRFEISPSPQDSSAVYAENHSLQPLPIPFETPGPPPVIPGHDILGSGKPPRLSPNRPPPPPPVLSHPSAAISSLTGPAYSSHFTAATWEISGEIDSVPPPPPPVLPSSVPTNPALEQVLIFESVHEARDEQSVPPPPPMLSDNEQPVPPPPPMLPDHKLSENLSTSQSAYIIHEDVVNVPPPPPLLPDHELSSHALGTSLMSTMEHQESNVNPPPPPVLPNHDLAAPPPAPNPAYTEPTNHLADNEPSVSSNHNLDSAHELDLMGNIDARTVFQAHSLFQRPFPPHPLSHHSDEEDETRPPQPAAPLESQNYPSRPPPPPPLLADEGRPRLVEPSHDNFSTTSSVASSFAKPLKFDPFDEFLFDPKTKGLVRRKSELELRWQPSLEWQGVKPKSRRRCNSLPPFEDPKFVLSDYLLRSRFLPRIPQYLGFQN